MNFTKVELNQPVWSKCFKKLAALIGMLEHKNNSGYEAAKVRFLLVPISQVLKEKIRKCSNIGFISFIGNFKET